MVNPLPENISKEEMGMIFFMVAVKHQLEIHFFMEILPTSTSMHFKGEYQHQVATTGFMEVIMSTFS